MPLQWQPESIPSLAVWGLVTEMAKQHLEVGLCDPWSGRSLTLVFKVLFDILTLY